MVKTLILDVESTGLFAEQGVILCACYESSDKPGVIQTLRNDVIAARHWARGRRGNDKEIVKRINAIVRKHDAIIAFNGKRFDLPLLRTRALAWNLEPLLRPRIIDPLLISWNHFRLRKNGLGNLGAHLRIAEQKTPLDLGTWREAVLNGCRKSMNLIVDHCKADVKLLSKMMPYIMPFVKNIDRKGSHE